MSKKKTNPPERGVVLCPLTKFLWFDMLIWSIRILNFLNTRFNIKATNTMEIVVPIIFIRYINTFYSVLPEPNANPHLSYP